MDTRIGQLWVEALESGKYSQATGKLAALNEDGAVTGFCCLGVLCELARAEGVIPDPIPADQYENGEAPYYATDEALVKDRLLYTDYAGDKSAAELPEAVRGWAGLDSDSPSVERTHINDDYDPESGKTWAQDEYVTDVESLAELNDGGHSFADIAQLIKDQLIVNEEAKDNAVNEYPTTPNFTVDSTGTAVETNAPADFEDGSLVEPMEDWELDLLDEPVTETRYINSLIPADGIDSLPYIMDQVLTGQGTFTGGDAATDATLAGLKRAFLSGVRWGSEFMEDESELDQAFDVYVLSEVVTAAMLSAVIE